MLSQVILKTVSHTQKLAQIVKSPSFSIHELKTELNVLVGQVKEAHPFIAEQSQRDNLIEKTRGVLTATVELQQNTDNQLLRIIGESVASPFYGLTDQSFKPQTPCLDILPGDRLSTVCDYNNPRSTPVLGGEGTLDEMCATFMTYFPRLPEDSDNFCGTIDSSGATGGF